LTKVILDKDTKLRDEWVNRVPMVSRTAVAARVVG